MAVSLKAESPDTSRAINEANIQQEIQTMKKNVVSQLTLEIDR